MITCNMAAWQSASCISCYNKSSCMLRITQTHMLCHCTCCMTLYLCCKSSSTLCSMSQLAGAHPSLRGRSHSPQACWVWCCRAQVMRLHPSASICWMLVGAAWCARISLWRPPRAVQPLPCMTSQRPRRPCPGQKQLLQVHVQWTQLALTFCTETHMLFSSRPHTHIELAHLQSTLIPAPYLPDL